MRATENVSGHYSQFTVLPFALLSALLVFTECMAIVAVSLLEVRGPGFPLPGGLSDKKLLQVADGVQHKHNLSLLSVLSR